MNCIIVDDEEMSRNMVKMFVDKTDSLKLIGVCSNAIEATNILSKNKVDLIFLDVEMPEMTGYDLIKSLATPPQVILITAKKDHAAEAFDYGVTDYLIKPITYSRFFQAVARAEDNISTSDVKVSDNNELYVRTDNKIVKINFEMILYIEALADYIMIITDDNNKYIVHSTMKGFQDRLPDSRFSRVHRSYIINTSKVEAIENQFVVLNGKHIPIGASYKDDFMKKLNML